MTLFLSKIIHYFCLLFFLLFPPLFSFFSMFSTRLFLVFFFCSFITLVFYASLEKITITKTIQQFNEKYSTTLNCPCSQVAVPYGNFMSFQPIFHHVCSSDFVQDQWIMDKLFDSSKNHRHFTQFNTIDHRHYSY